MFEDTESLPDEPYERALVLQEMLISYATGGKESDPVYKMLRAELMQRDDVKPILPVFVKSCRTLSAFWGWIKQTGGYEPRRTLIREAFTQLLDYLEGGRGAPLDQSTSDVLVRFDADGVHHAWDRALKRRDSDPEGAITAARTLLEAVCKRILEEEGVPYGPHDDLPKLYGTASKQLNLAPSQHTEVAFKTILGGCHSVVDGLSTIRNRISDAHASGGKPVRPAPRHAALAVNLAGSMAVFLVETWKHRKQKSQ